MRVVVDTNVVVSRYVAPRGRPAQVLNHWQQGDFDLLVSEPILREYERVLGYDHVRTRHLMSDEEITDIIEDFGEFAIVVDPSEKLAVVKDDPDDDKFLECAV